HVTFTRSASPADPHSFPTRRSSDLGAADVRERLCAREGREDLVTLRPENAGERSTGPLLLAGKEDADGARPRRFPMHACPLGARSEEHTSELQSRFDLVCRLLLEKK